MTKRDEIRAALKRRGITGRVSYAVAREIAAEMETTSNYVYSIADWVAIRPQPQRFEVSVHCHAWECMAAAGALHLCDKHRVAHLKAWER